MSQTPKRWIIRDPAEGTEALRASDIYYTSAITVGSALDTLSAGAFDSTELISITGELSSKIVVLETEIVKYIPLSGSTGIFGDLNPLYSDLYNLGSDSLRWDDIFIGTYGSIETELGTLHSSITSNYNYLTGQINTVSGDVITNSNSISVIQSDIISVNSDITNLSSEIDSTNSNLNTVSGDLDTAEVVITSNTNRIDGLVSDLPNFTPLSGTVDFYGNLTPLNDNSYSLGISGYNWSDLYINPDGSLTAKLVSLDSSIASNSADIATNSQSIINTIVATNYNTFLINGLTSTVGGNVSDISTNTSDIAAVSAATCGLTGSYLDLATNQTAAGNKTFTNDVTVNGTFTANSAIVIVSEIVSISANYLTLNNNVTGLPTEDAGIIVNRALSADAKIEWNETTDKWQVGTVGDLEDIIVTSDIGTLNTAEWDSTHSTVLSNSASWAGGGDVTSGQLSAYVELTDYDFTYIGSEPSGSAYPGSRGQKYFDATSGYMYECVSSDAWVRWVAATSF